MEYCTFVFIDLLPCDLTIVVIARRVKYHEWVKKMTITATPGHDLVRGHQTLPDGKEYWSLLPSIPFPGSAS
jgi:hypothetical protein